MSPSALLLAAVGASTVTGWLFRLIDWLEGEAVTPMYRCLCGAVFDRPRVSAETDRHQDGWSQPMTYLLCPSCGLGSNISMKKVTTMTQTPPEALDFDPQTHTYTLAGKTLPSVTQLVSIFGPPPLKEGDDLELTLEAAADRGATLHAYLEHRLGGGSMEDFELPDDYRPYVDAVELFLSEHRLTPMLVETPLWGEVQGVAFAGTPDFVGEFDGRLSVLDWKFVSQVQKTKVGAQLSGYWELCAANGAFPESLYCVQFLADGTYRLYPAGMTADDFHLCLRVYQTANKRHPRGEIA